MAYYFPPPRMFLRVGSQDRRTRYLTNWLACRSAWIARISISNPSPAMGRSWRDFLNNIPANLSTDTYSSTLMKDATDFFGPDFTAIHRADLGQVVSFRGMSLRFDSLKDINNATLRKILWDLYKHNFHCKLVTLDKCVVPHLWLSEQSTRLEEVLQIFPGGAGHSMSAVPFPMRNKGLASSEPTEKRAYVEKLRHVMSSWPGFPQDLADPLLPYTSSPHVWAIKKKLAVFYCQTFFDYFGRPPMLPHQIPAAPRVIYNSATGQ
ncbi:hypothetical protein HYDPIDRAFT_169893 [Hydnomerulius pinastri MD-312]|uniref:Uncharacterized protein n=1 Tax=Hydnomerulius pinastri MD-312 TaxID=994086 RepID=A0A0C9VTD2_9AGAM|nr:hypothetical protein HYDPIDRAFT_169893 [Hydnomerulius pinastri MD-312]